MLAGIANLTELGFGVAVGIIISAYGMAPVLVPASRLWRATASGGPVMPAPFRKPMPASQGPTMGSLWRHPRTALVPPARDPQMKPRMKPGRRSAEAAKPRVGIL